MFPVTHPGDGQGLVEVLPPRQAEPPGCRAVQHHVEWHDPLVPAAARQQQQHTVDRTLRGTQSKSTAPWEWWRFCTMLGGGRRRRRRMDRPLPSGEATCQILGADSHSRCSTSTFSPVLPVEHLLFSHFFFSPQTPFPPVFKSGATTTSILTPTVFYHTL